MIKQIKQLTSKALKHPVISAAIGGVIVVIVTPLISSFSYTAISSVIYNLITNTLSSIAAWFAQDITMQLWLLILIGLALLIALPLIMLIAKSRNEQASKTHSNYNRDSILGVNWMWSWNRDYDEKLYIHSLTPLCPECSNILNLEYGDQIVTCSNLECSWWYKNPTLKGGVAYNKIVNSSDSLTRLTENEIIRRMNTRQFSNAGKGQLN